jgi:transcription initiation factor TFIIIB Brf1 subunit/transcription initiation factor TFIIB
MTDKLPDKIVNIGVLRINHNSRKICTCDNRTFTIDTKNRIVTCNQCGAIIDPFEVLIDITEHWERMEERTQRLLEQRREIENYKPWLIVIRDLERQYKGKQYLPVCPHCDKAFYLEELVRWVNREIEEARRKKEKGCSDGG